jgi:hypothetical protein
MSEVLNDKSFLPIPKTILPKGLKLTDEEIIELCKLEEQCDAMASLDASPTLAFDSSRGMFVPSNRIIHFSFISTTNIGVHYFCVERNIALKVLSNNRHLSKEMVLLIFNKIKPFRGNDKEATQVNLLCHRVVFNDLELFAKLFFILFPENKKSILTSVGVVISYAPIDILMFMLPIVFKVNNKEQNISYKAVAINRSFSVLEWVEQNEPELAGLPLSWIFKTYGFKG